MMMSLMKNVPLKNIIFTLHDGTTFPLLKEFRPDFVLCDVPCSGDGTLRKTKNLQKKWKITDSLNNFDIQLKLLTNAARICKEGGEIVYSTCSLNPVENEAVLVAFMRKYNGSFKIKNVSKQIPFKTRKGLVRYRIPVKSDLSEYSESYRKDKDWLPLVKEGMFDVNYTERNHKSKSVYVIF